MILLFGIAWLATPRYWHYEYENEKADSLELNSGLTEKGHPWIGALEPETVIEIFSDYMCFQCSQANKVLLALVRKTPNTIRVVHHQYPLDHSFNPTVVQDPFHVGSGKLSLLGVYATQKGKFWEMNEILFQIGRSKEDFNTKVLAEKSGFNAVELTMALTDPTVRKILNRDIRLGMKLRITATPTFLINDKLYTGSIPVDIYKQLITDD